MTHGWHEGKHASELARVLVRFDHVARLVINVNHRAVSFITG